MKTILVASLLAACSSTPSPPDRTYPGALFNYPVAQVHAAAKSALAEQGFKITASQLTHIEAKRPRSLGRTGFYRNDSLLRMFTYYLVTLGLSGSGGETVGIWFAPDSPDETRVEIYTEKYLKKSMGQRNWDDELLVAIRNYLADNS